MKNNGLIGIVTWHYYGNFGSALQSYALQEAIRQMKLGEVEIINYHNPKFGYPNKLKDFARYVLAFSIGRFFSQFVFGSLFFQYKYLRESKIATNESELNSFAPKYRTIVCGSDQIWAPNCYNPVYFASFANSDTRKVSYAASIGLNVIPDNLVQKYKEHLKGFYAISVREEEGEKLLKEKCEIDSSVVLDPTLLHDAFFYRKIQRKVKGINGKYLLCYFLNENHQYENRVREYATKHNLQIIGVSARVQDGEWMQRLSNLGADHFIWLVNHAETVMTDSYHGTIFSLLFHKNFWTFLRFNENDPICQNSRIRQLKSYFGECVKIVGPNDAVDENVTTDYKIFEKSLKTLRQDSLDFLCKALH